MDQFVLAVDQGTTSSRAIIFNESAKPVGLGQLEHRQMFPRAGWVEHDALEIWNNVREVIAIALSRADLTSNDLAAVGVANQRETTVVWDRHTGKPVTNAIVWQDTRTQAVISDIAGSVGVDRYRGVVGLPLATYFAGPKVRWILDEVAGAREAADRGDLLFGSCGT
jgi:glycerol kinase